MNGQRIALVTGGNRGIGQATVHLLCQRGVRTIFTCRNPHDGQLALADLGSLARQAEFHPLELTEQESVESLAGFMRTRHGRLDILVNNAGVNYDDWQRVSSVSMAEVEYTLDVNLLGAWRMCNALLPLLQTGQGRIINVSSGAGTFAAQDGTTPAYSLSKGALNMLTRALARDLSRRGIAVNSVDPGWVRTAMGGDAAPLSPEEGADAIVWLATEAGQEVTGGFFRRRQQVEW